LVADTTTEQVDPAARVFDEQELLVTVNAVDGEVPEVIAMVLGKVKLEGEFFGSL
jgi:hypothetical protein